MEICLIICWKCHVKTFSGFYMHIACHHKPPITQKQQLRSEKLKILSLSQSSELKPLICIKVQTLYSTVHTLALSEVCKHLYVLKCTNTCTLSEVYTHWYYIWSVYTLVLYLKCIHTGTISEVYTHWYYIWSVYTLVLYLIRTTLAFSGGNMLALSLWIVHTLVLQAQSPLCIVLICVHLTLAPAVLYFLSQHLNLRAVSDNGRMLHNLLYILTRCDLEKVWETQRVINNTSIQGQVIGERWKPRSRSHSSHSWKVRMGRVGGQGLN